MIGQGPTPWLLSDVSWGISLRSLSCFCLCEQSGDLVWTIDFDTGEEKQRLCDNERVVRESSDI